MIDRERIEADAREALRHAYKLANNKNLAAATVFQAVSKAEDAALAALAAAEDENARLREALTDLSADARLVVHDHFSGLPEHRAAAKPAFVRLDHLLFDAGGHAKSHPALASRPGEEKACERCHGDGVITVGGTSVNPRTGALGPDPQAAEDAVCPDCAGTGVAPRAGERAAE